MGKIINDHFEVGQRYRGMVDGAELKVVGIKEAGTYEMQHAYTGTRYTYTLKSAHICFQDVKTGASFEIGMDTAKRLLLRLIEE